MNIDNYIALLGRKGKDRVTGFEGVVTSLSFDLYGCVQIVLMPKAGDEEVKTGHWFDLPRIQILKGKPVMPAPNFYDIALVGGKGPAEKPMPNN